MAGIEEKVSAEVSRLLQAGVAGRVFPGGTACVSWFDGTQVRYASGHAGLLEEGGSKVDKNTPYDLASLTKPIVATVALKLVANGKLALDSQVDRLLSDVRGGAAAQSKLEDLLTHRAPIASWGGLYLDVPHEVGTPAARRWILSEASRRPREEGQAGAAYSDLGYLIAGEAIARAAGKSLDKLVEEYIAVPLEIQNQLFFPSTLPADRRSQIASLAAPTEWCEWRGRVVRGEVHDENAAAFGGVAGHAGLFGTCYAVARIGREMLEVLWERSDYLRKDLLEEALKPRPGGTYRLGWDAKSPEGSLVGRRMGSRCFGHHGFTGTSLWCDPDKDVAIALLTNRVHPSRANEKIKGFRPAFHDGMLATVGRILQQQRAAQ